VIASAALLAGLAAASIATSFVSGILGMAGGMILLGILVAVLPLPAAMALHGVTQLASNGWRAAMLRREIDWRIVRGYAAGALVALGAFTLARVVLPKPAVLIAMGVAPFIGLALPERVVLNVERRGHSFACGLACAALSLTAGIAGPLLDIFFVRSGMNRHRVIATKALTQVLSHFLKIVYYGAIVAAPGAALDMAVAAMMVGTAFVGTSLSGRVLERMSDASFRAWTRRVIMALGVVYLATGVASLVR
jgi:uncharacterized membrane protein YfcA